MAKNVMRRIANQSAFYPFLGLLAAILIARTYVYLGGNLGLGYDGIVFHHIFLGIIIVVVSGFVFFAFNRKLAANKRAMDAMAFTFGFGTGLITDETNFLVSIGQYYSLVNYYNPLNFYVDAAFILLSFSILLFSLFSKRFR